MHPLFILGITMSFSYLVKKVCDSWYECVIDDYKYECVHIGRYYYNVVEDMKGERYNSLTDWMKSIAPYGYSVALRSGRNGGGGVIRKEG